VLEAFQEQPDGPVNATLPVPPAPLKLWLESAGISAIVGVVADAVFARRSAATAVRMAIVVDSARVMKSPFER